MSDPVQQRLLNQRIIGTKPGDPAEAVRWMTALQAQMYAQAVWAIGLRTQSAARVDIEQAIADRKIIRAWPLRGTIHFVPAEDAKWMVQLSSDRLIAGDKRRQEQLGLDEETLARSLQIFSSALQGGRVLTRPEMMEVLETAGISTEGQRGYHLLWYAAQTGLICMGPMQGKQQTFVLLDEWVPDARELLREAALAELARRYIHSHGPATAQDFAWWSGLTLTDARAGLQAGGNGLVSETIDGNETWCSEDDQPVPEPDPESVHLLPAFDEYILGYTNRSAVLPNEHATKIVPGKNGMFRPMLVVGGQVVGTWKQNLKKGAIEITLNPFEEPSLPQQRLEAEAQRYSDFLGVRLSNLSIGD